MAIKSLAYCLKCRDWDKPLHKNATGACSISYMCRECRNDKQKGYYERNKEKCRAIIYKSIKKHQHKQNARVKLNYAVQAGKIIRPDTCSRCKQPGRIQGHHHDYSKPLDVEWLCTGCHADEKDKS